jgi:TPR repeat protein
MYDSNSDLLARSQAGDVHAQSILSQCYASGTCIKQDYEKALYWRLQAAKGGDKMSQFEMGYYYFTEKNEEKASYWFRRATGKRKIDIDAVAEYYRYYWIESGCPFVLFMEPFKKRERKKRLKENPHD